MAKKTKKGTAVKKMAKPIKKAAAKKAAPKKVSKPVKKTIAKKIVKPVKKQAAKKVAPKPTKKLLAKPVKMVKAKIEVVKKPLPAAPKLPMKADLKTKKKKGSYDDIVAEMQRPEIKIDLSTAILKKLEKPQPIPQVNKDTRTRYNDSELQEFKKLILEKLAEARKDYELLKSTLSHKDDHGTDDTSPTFKLLEDGSDVLSKEETAHLASRQEKFIMNLQNALIRIENKTYGICRATGKLISKERLRSVPHATLSIDAKLEQTT